MTETANLSAGRTAYEWFGPQGGPVAVCIHGLTTPSYIFAGTARSMASLGYRTLTYDLWGRGGSDRPSGRQTPEYFLDQLQDLLGHEGINGPVTLIGYSMGAVLAARYAVEAAFQPRALILLAPAGFEPQPRSRAATLMKAPVIGDLWSRIAGRAALRRAAEAARGQATLVPDLVDRQIRECDRPGYPASVLSSLRHTLTKPADDDHRALARMGVPLLAIWGDDDPVIGKTAIGRLAQLNPAAHHVQIAGAGHALPQTHPREVAEAIRAFV